jgi:Alternative oxidase
LVPHAPSPPPLLAHQYVRQNEEALRNVDAVPLIAKEYYEAEDPPRRISSMYDVLVAIRDDERHHSDQLRQFGEEALCER